MLCNLPDVSHSGSVSYCPVDTFTLPHARLMPSFVSCDIFSKRDENYIPHMLEYNDTRNWEPGEAICWRNPAPKEILGPQQMLMLEFNCASLPEICNNICFGMFCKLSFSVYP